MVYSTVYLSDSKENCEKVKHALCFTMFIDDEIINASSVKVERMNCTQEQYGVIVHAETQKHLNIIKGFVQGYVTGWNHREFVANKKPDEKQNRL